MQILNTRRGRALGIAVVLLTAAAAWAATEVTVTKTSSRTAAASQYDGTTGSYVSLMETDDGFMLNYTVYTYDFTQTPAYTIVEQGYGTIGANEASISATGAWVDADTSGLAVIGDGGTIDVQWTADGLVDSSTNSKVTTDTSYMRQIRFNGYSMTSAIASGDVFDKTFTATGQIQTSKGKTIVQIK